MPASTLLGSVLPLCTRRRGRGRDAHMAAWPRKATGKALVPPRTLAGAGALAGTATSPQRRKHKLRRRFASTRGHKARRCRKRRSTGTPRRTTPGTRDRKPRGGHTSLCTAWRACHRLRCNARGWRGAADWQDTASRDRPCKSSCKPRRKRPRTSGRIPVACRMGVGNGPAPPSIALHTHAPQSGPRRGHTAPSL